MNIHTLRRIALTLLRPDTTHRMEPSDFLFCSSDADKSDVISGKHVDRILDPIAYQLQEMGYKTTSLALPYSKFVGNICLRFTFSMNWSALVAGKLDSLLGDKKPDKSKLTALYKRILQRSMPTAIFAIDAPSELCRAARDLGIPVIEVLHGYGYVRVFDNWALRDRVDFPSLVVAFDNQSAQIFEQFSEGRYSVVRTEKLWSVHYLSIIEEVNSNKNRLLGEQNKPEDFHILYSMQAGDLEEIKIIDPEDDSSGLMIHDSVLGAVRLSGTNFHWYFRLHPTQMVSEKATKTTKMLSKLLESYPNASWQDASQAPLTNLISQMTHHITLMSMVSYQAAEAGIPTLLLSPTLKTGEINQFLFKDLRDEHYAYFIDEKVNADKILAWISRTSQLERRLDQNENVSTLDEIIGMIPHLLK